MIKFNNVDKNFGEIIVLKDMSFKVNKGEIIGFVGPSGCGKSTILNIIGGIYEADEGEVSVNGCIGYMFQKDNLLNWYKVYDNIALGLKIQKKKNNQLINRLLTEYGLIDYLKLYPRELSGGLRQRVALIRTLVIDPDILLLDEPFSALDAQTRVNVALDVKKIIKKEEKTAILVTHDIHEALLFADRILLLSAKPCKIKKEYNSSDATYDEIWSELKND